MDQGDISSILNAVVELLKRREVSKAEAKLTSVREQIHQSMLASRREAVDEINMDVVALKIQVEEIDLVPPETTGMPEEVEMQCDDDQGGGQRQNPFRLARSRFCQPSEIYVCRHNIGLKIGTIPVCGTQNLPK